MIKNPINLLPANEVSDLITLIESLLTGYWYSISQTKTEVTLNVGPSLYCLLDTDRAWAMTSEGDSGIIIRVPRDKYFNYDAIVSKFTSDVIGRVVKARQLMLEADTPLPAYVGRPRQHSSDDRKKFRKRYAQLVRNMEQYAVEDIDIGEVYMGSCYLSADMSLRGVYCNKPFDFSCDVKDDGTLAVAFYSVLTELDTTLLKLGV